VLQGVDLALGAGELMVTSIDREGTGEGFDLELTRCIAESVSIPVIACGGAGNVTHAHEAIARGKADAVSVASILHYQCYKEFQYQEHDFSREGNLEFRRRGAGFSRIQGVTLQQIKEYLIGQGILCRPAVKDGAYD
jgi:cyclase